MLLFDTHVLIWLTEDNSRLGKRTARMADAALSRSEISVSSFVFWEVAVLAVKGRIELMTPMDRWRLAALALGIVEIPLTGDIAVLSVGLRNFHADPADRIMVATALATNATLVTADDRILRWPGGLKTSDARR